MLNSKPLDRICESQRRLNGLEDVSRESSFHKSVLTVVVVATIVMSGLLAGCRNDDVNLVSSSPTNNKRVGIIAAWSPAIDSIGIYHNIGCDSALGTNVSGASSIADTVVLMVTRAWAGLHNAVGMDTAGYIDQEMKDTVTAIAPLLYPAVSSSFLLVKNRVAQYSGWATGVSSGDKAILDSVYTFFSTYSTNGKTRAQVYNEIVVKANSLIAFYNTQSWSGAGSGELAGGLVYIMKHSAQQWDSYSSGLPTGDFGGTPEFSPIIVQADCFGYLTGWANSVRVEIRDHGSLNVNNQYKRISDGLWGAVTGSCYGWWKR